MSIQLLFGDHAEDVKPPALCSLCESPCIRVMERRGVFPGEPRFKPRTFFSTFTTASALQKFANGIILLTCKYPEFTLYTKIRKNISCCVHVRTSGIDSSLICDPPTTKQFFLLVVLSIYILTLCSPSLFLPPSINPFSVLEPKIISRVSWIAQRSWCQELSGSDWLGAG